MLKKKAVDITYIHGLSIDTIIGICDWEQEQKQPLLIDIDIESCFDDAVASDNIKDCIDYTAIKDDIDSLAQNHSFQLLESFAQAIAQNILDNYPAYSVRIKINKPLAIEQAQATGIIIERRK